VFKEEHIVKYTIAGDRVVPAPRKLAWAVVGLSCALAGSAALAWQNGGSKLRSTQIEEADIALPTQEVPPPKLTAKPAAPKAAVKPPVEESPDDALPPARPRVSAPATAAPTTAKPSIRTQPKSQTARKPTSQRSFLPFPLPSFSYSKSAEPANQPRPSNLGPRAMQPAAGAKISGQTGGSYAPVRGRPNASAADEPKLAELPTPARREPNLASRGTPTKRTDAPVAEAPVIEMPGSKSAKPGMAAKPIPAKVKSANNGETSLPVASGSQHKLAPLQYAQHNDVRPAGFQEVTPGETKISGIAQHLGEPVSSEREGDTTVMTYQIGPFPKVEVILAGDLVDSVVIHLKEPVAEKDVLSELGLTSFQPVEIRDEHGDILGKAVPERGVALSYHGDVAERKVGQVVLAVITTEPFLTRALDSEHHLQQMLADADYVAGHDSNSAEPLAVRARVYQLLGRNSEARTAIEAAIKADAGASDYRLLYARLLGEAGDTKNALKMAESVADNAGVPGEFVAQAELVWGDLLSHGADRDYPSAVDHHTKAIKLATALADDKEPAIRKAALRTLIDANLAIARDVALGNYKRKSDVVPKWIAKAEAAKDLAAREGDADYLELHVAAGTLAAHVCLTEPLDPTPFVEVALAKGQDLIANSDDPLFKQHVEWMLGCALLNAVQIEHARGEFDVATKYANNALALLRDNLEHREATPERDFVMGRMYFAMGALYAVGKEDHAEAVHYYLQAIHLLEKASPSDLADDQGRHGERFVSMGVSFWQNGNKNQAVDLTLKGSELLHAAVDEGHIEKTSLAVPYSNLAAMYKSLGNTSEAKKYGDLARLLDEPKSRR
jgi:tetratricopeptide (TPR) repeat protein